MISFEVGKRYAEIDEYLTEYEVIARTKAFVTVKNNQGKTQRIKVWTHDNDGVEALGSLLRASFEIGNELYLDFKNRVEISNQKVANAMQADDARFNRFVETLRAA